ncbi:poly polymerase catalytic domain-containing protein [Pyronema omphalodes]|nr:poly polymerase catalytic domain-containing protein [Pyronema omphalodes]
MVSIKSTIFANLTIAVSGTHKNKTHRAIELDVQQHSGTFASAITDEVTHLISTVYDVSKDSAKVQAAVTAGIPIVTLEWLLKSIEANAAQDAKDYLVKDCDAESGKKRSATPEVKDEDEQTPAAKKTKAEDGTARPTRAKLDSKDTKSTTETSKQNDEDGKDAVVIANGRGKRGAAKTVTTDSDSKDDTKVPAKAKTPEPEMKTVLRKGKAPVDELSLLQNTHHVYVGLDGCARDGTLNLTDIKGNNNKFYQLQLLEPDNRNPNGYCVFAHWGRVGERGQIQFKANMVPLILAEAAFDKAMKAKSGQTWAFRHRALGGGSKYAYLERNYDDDDEDEDKPAENEETPKPKSLIAPQLQNLMKLIFNTQLMEQSMASLSYDARKLPLGKLSKTTIQAGYEVLKQIGLELQSTSPNQGELMRLSSQYYTVIPHNFGRRNPTVINTPQLLKQETTLVENLVDMKITSEILATAYKEAGSVHPLDYQFNKLGLDEATPLDKTSTEFQHLEAYVKKTHGKTHYMKLHVEEIFRVRRNVEEERFSAGGFDKFMTSDNRKLLWHGSRTTNFGGILSQGLRIAPPEAPVNGYMFDKGIYLADIVSKSAGYCSASSSNNTGLLLLCEAQLGSPMYELQHSDYYAASNSKAKGAFATKGCGRTAPLAWEDAGVVNPQLKGVQMPKVSGTENSITGDVGKNGSLQYNEYIVYDVAQVKLRYLVRFPSALFNGFRS